MSQPPDRRWGVALLAMACMALCAYEPWAIFVRETPSLVIEGVHDLRADEFGHGARVSQGFQMVGAGFNAVDLRFATDVPLTMVLRYNLLRATVAGPIPIGPAHTGLVTIKQVSGTSWRRIPFPPVEASQAEMLIIDVDLVAAAVGDDPNLKPVALRKPDTWLPAALMMSRENIVGGGELWIEGRRQVGSLFLRAFTRERTAYALFQAQVLPKLPAVLGNPMLHVLVAIAYQAALATVVFALLIGRDARSES